MNRMGKPEDLIGSLIYLLDEKNHYVTGQNLIVDGGRTIIWFFNNSHNIAKHRVFYRI